MAEVIWETGLDLTTLGLEMTEIVVTVDGAPVLDAMQELNVLGLELALDDFGAGHT